jgi:molybdopterin molybdotransferase
MTPPIPLEEAWQRLFALASPLGAETVPVDDSVGRYLAGDLPARRTQPARDLSVMDGFAVAGGEPWRVIGESRAGAPFAGDLGSGDAVRISTGAACPAGTEGIVLREDATLDGAMLTAATPEAGRWIRRRGFDFAEGATILEARTRIGPAQLALARMAGHASLNVGRRPRVAVVEIGDELVGDPADCPADRLPASNGAMVAAMVREAGGTARRIGPLPDDRARLVDILLDRDADVIVTTAGASVGEHDHVRGALEESGWELAFWRVAIRPGKPLLVARRGHQIVLGLPGNPNSSFVTAFLFLLPLLRVTQGAAHALPAAIPLPLAEALPAGEDRREFRRARFVEGRALPLAERDSSALRTLGAADLLIDRPIHSPAAAVGTPVPSYWIGSGQIA